MKKFLLFTLLIAFTCSFLIKDRLLKIKKDIEANLHKQNYLTSCSNGEVNTLYNAIANCQMPSSVNTVDCITNNLYTKLNQKWDVFTKAHGAYAGTAFWVSNNCSITLNNYGKYNRTYIAWPSAVYNFTIEANTSCEAARNSTVLSAISRCQMLDQTNSAQCILNTLRVNLNEYWDIYAAGRTADAGVRYWFYDNCTLRFQNYGSFNRTYIAWKAYGSYQAA